METLRTMPKSGLYTGRVTHRRVRPKAHTLGYKVFNLLLDLDEIDGLAGRLRVFSRNRFNLLSFHDRDHGDGSGAPLRGQIEAWLAQAGHDLGGGPIRLLCMPRVLGYGFNPLSVYFCHDAEGRLAVIVYEVSNTFGERHSYLVPVDPQDRESGTIRQSCDKRFYVSPFLDMDLVYQFDIQPPGERVHIAVLVRDEDGPVIATAFVGVRGELSDSALVRTLLALPALTLKVMGAIHWEALRMWLKGMTIKTRPPAPAQPVTVVAGRRERQEIH